MLVTKIKVATMMRLWKDSGLRKHSVIPSINDGNAPWFSVSAK